MRRKLVHINSCSLVACLALLAACATSGDGGTGSLLNAPDISTEGMQSGCFYTRQVSNWEGVNRNQLIVYAPRNQAYLVRIAPPANSMRFSSTIGFGGRDRICGRTGERLVLGSGLDRIYAIVDVRRMDEERLIAYQARIEAAKNSQPEPAADSPAAEIEEDIQPDGTPE